MPRRMRGSRAAGAKRFPRKTRATAHPAQDVRVGVILAGIAGAVMAAHNGVSLNWGGLDRALGNAIHRMGDTQDLMDSIGEALRSSTLKRFDDEEDPTGKKWEPSARAATEGGKTLDKEGHLKDSIDYHATSSKVMVGSNLPYARIHQKGGKTSPHVIRPKRKKALAFGGVVRKKVNHPGSDIPARPYLGISDDDREEIMDTMTDFLEGAFK